MRGFDIRANGLQVPATGASRFTIGEGGLVGFRVYI